MPPRIPYSPDELRKRSVFLATPMYGAQCCGNYQTSSMVLARDLHILGIQCSGMTMNNESCISRARNNVADEFFHSGCTHAMLVDSDVGYRTEHVVQMLALADPASDKQILAAPYPRKRINWERVRDAALAGFGKDDPSELEQFSSDFVLSMPEGTTEIELDDPLAIREVGCGFMMVQRGVFERIANRFPEHFYTMDAGYISPRGTAERRIMGFFNGGIDHETDRYLSDDYFFCSLARECGLKIWLCPWMELTHQGTYVYKGLLRRVAEMDDLKKESRSDAGIAVGMRELPHEDHGALAELDGSHDARHGQRVQS